HAVLAYLRRPETRLPRPRFAPPRQGACLGRAGLDLRLDQVRGRIRHEHRHAHLRRLGPAQGPAARVWLHGREGGRGGPAAIEESRTILKEEFVDRIGPSEATTMAVSTPRSKPSELREAQASRAVPLLENGQRLTREEFERRYDAMPDLKKAELIEGVVYVPSPVNHRSHGRPHAHLTCWLGVYEASTAGVEVGDNSSVRLDLANM